MKIHPLIALFLVLAPPLAGAEISLDSLKEGATKAAKAVGDTTKGAVDAAGEAAGMATGAGLSVGLGGFASQLVIARVSV